MPKYRVATPNGEEFEVEAPEGATEDDAIAYVQANYETLKAAKPQKADFSNVKTTVSQSKKAPEQGAIESAVKGYAQRQIDGGKGAVEGIKQAGLGVVQSVLQGGPGASAARYIGEKLRPQTTADLVAGPRRDKLDVTGLAADAVGRVSQSSRQAFEATDAGQSYAGKANAMAGQYGPTALIPGQAASIPGRIGLGAAQGALAGNLQPVEPGQSRAANVALGAAGGGVGSTAGEFAMFAAKTFKAVKQAFPTLSDSAIKSKVRDILEEAARNPANLDRANPSAIPGVKRSLAEETGDPGIAQLQRQFPVEMEASALANNSKRMDYIRSNFGGASPEAVEAQRQAVMNAAGPDLQAARKATGADTGKLINWLERAPNSLSFRGNEEVGKALAQVRGRIAVPIDDAGRLRAARSVAKDSIENKGRMSGADFQLLKNARTLIISGQNSGLPADEVLKLVSKIKPKSVAAGAALDDMRRALKKAEFGRDDVASLYEARKKITKEMMPAAIAKQDGAVIKALKGTIQKLDEQIKEVAPTYQKYLTGYREGMKKADQIKVGANLVSRGTAQATGERAIQPARFLSATDNLSSLLPRSAQSRNIKPEKLLAPEQMTAISNLRDDLTRVKELATSGRAVGSPTKQNFDTGAFVQDAISQGVSKELASIAPLGAGSVVKVFNNLSEKKVNALLVEVLADPAKARQLRSILPPRQMAVIQARLDRYSRPSGLSRVASAAALGASAPSDGK